MDVKSTLNTQFDGEVNLFIWMRWYQHICPSAAARGDTSLPANGITPYGVENDLPSAKCTHVKC